MGISVDKFVADMKVHATFESVAENPKLIPPATTRIYYMKHWKVYLKRRGTVRSSFTVYFTKYLDTPDKKYSPSIEEVIDSLALDALCLSQNRKELETEFQITPETCKMYLEICTKRANGLKRLLGPSGFEMLLNEVDRIIVK